MVGMVVQNLKDIRAESEGYLCVVLEKYPEVLDPRP